MIQNFWCNTANLALKGVHQPHKISCKTREKTEHWPPTLTSSSKQFICHTSKISQEDKEGSLTTGSLTIARSPMIFTPPFRFSRILISRLIFFFFTGWNIFTSFKYKIRCTAERNIFKPLIHLILGLNIFSDLLKILCWSLSSIKPNQGEVKFEWQH